MEQKFYEYDALIHEVPDNGGAYVIFPWNIREEFGKGRIKVHAEFDGIPYDGSIVNMGVKDENGNVCYIIGLLKAIRSDPALAGMRVLAVTADVELQPNSSGRGFDGIILKPITRDKLASELAKAWS